MKTALLFLPLMTFATTASALSFKAQIQPLKLPLNVPMSNPPSIPNVQAGQMTIGMYRVCGDADVAQFKSDHPSFDIVDDTVSKMNVLVGYWTTDDAESPLPTETNWTTVGFIKLDIAENQSDLGSLTKPTIIPLNHSVVSGINGLDVLGKEIVELYEQAKRSTANFGPVRSKRIYAGAMTCLNPSNSTRLSPPYTYVPSFVEVGSYLAHPQGLIKQASDAASTLVHMRSQIDLEKTAAPNSDTLYMVNYGESAKPYKAKFDSGTNLMGALFNKFKSLKDFNYSPITDDVYVPTGCDTLPPPVPPATAAPCVLKTKRQQYDEQMEGLKTTLALASSDASGCSSFGASVNQSYKWEVFPQNASCNYLLNGITNVSYSNLFDSVFNPGSIPTSDHAFKALVTPLARRLWVATVIENAHNILQADATLVKTNSSCLNSSGQPLIERLVGSYPIKFFKAPTDATRYKLQSNKFNHVHPEPLFALGDSARYLSDNLWAVWGQVLEKDAPLNNSILQNEWSILIPSGNKIELDNNKIDSSTIKSDAINILFKIRSISETPSCPMYC